MKYNLNGKNINIPDADIKRSIAVLNISKEEAIKVWLEDEGYIENSEQLELEKKAKQNKIKHEARALNPKPKTQKERVKKQDVTKERLIAEIADTIRKLASDVVIENPSKIITFKLEGDNFKIDLIRRNKKKVKS